MKAGGDMIKDGLAFMVFAILFAFVAGCYTGAALQARQDRHTFKAQEMVLKLEEGFWKQQESCGEAVVEARRILDAQKAAVRCK